jgi:dihydrofolate reductase
VKRVVGVIVAMSPEGTIGLHGTIPWRHPGDQRRFKRLTVGTTVVMGRKTWESLPKKPLPDRRNVVLTRTPIEGVECHPDLPSALAAAPGDVWVIGGARAYAEAMEHADQLDVTYVPDRVDHPDAVKFPAIDPRRFEAGEIVAHEDAAGLTRRTYRRIPTSA